MEYSKLVAVTGLPGLFELITSKTDGAIVRSLDDKSTRFVSSRIHHFSHLESIEVYTTHDNVNLVDVLNAMGKADNKLPDDKDPAAVKKYFQRVYPGLDFERVYYSDLKKMIKWYEALKENNVEIRLAEIPEEPELEAVKAETAKNEKSAGESSKKTASSETGKKPKIEKSGEKQEKKKSTATPTRSKGGKK